MKVILHLAATVGLAFFSAAQTGLAATAAEVDFDRDVRPILSERCFTCHGPDDGTRVNALRFDLEEAAFERLASGGFAIVRGNPQESVLLDRVMSGDPARRMPPSYKGFDKLPDSEVEVLRSWIEQGAPWAQHWSFVPPTRPQPPPVERTDLVRNAIDRFVLRQLEDEGLRPQPEAAREALIRRLALDLTGLPPSLEEVDRFLSDTDANAYAKLVDRMLASPRYGERMATPWLDAARYADTNGYQMDGTRDMWRWRDWVVEAFNSNMGFDQFTIEQIAGDLLPNATLDQKIATGFHRNLRTNAEGGIVEEEFLVEYAADRVATTSTVWLGLTMECARCHDHKYDPLTQKEFYQLFAYFNNVPERGLVYHFGNDGPMIKAPTDAQSSELAKLDRKILAAEQRLEELEPGIKEGISAWARSLAKHRKADWSVSEGLVAHYPFRKARLDYAEWEEMPQSHEPGARRIDLAEGRQGSAGLFEEAQSVDLGDLGGFDYNDPFTFSFWINPKGANGAILTRTLNVEKAQGYGLYLVDGKLRFELTHRYTDLSMRIISKQPLALNRWQHVALTYTAERPSSRGARFYVDGQPWPFEVEWDDLKWPSSYAFPFRLGAGGGRPSFQGRLDELRIYTRALSADEVSVLSLDDSLPDIAALPAEQRTPAQAMKFLWAYLDTEAPKRARQAIAALKMARLRRTLFAKNIPSVMVMTESEKANRAHVLRRGAYDARGEKVEPATPAVLTRAGSRGPQTRLDLARWLVSRENPLTARVAVNRYWEMLFGVGLVKTSEDFGTQGERPLHSELLDWLAVEFMDNGWDVKMILKTIVISAAYRRSSSVTPELMDRDPENRLLTRGPRFRLPAEVIRDQALSLSGLLDETMGGPTVKPYQPPGIWNEVSGATYQEDSGSALYRRSLYTYWKRTVPPPSMVAFDAADRESCQIRRPRTNTPIQALTLMNDPTYVEASRKLAERMMHEGGATTRERLSYGFWVVTSLRPRQSELEVLEKAFEDFRIGFLQERKAAVAYLSVGESQRDTTLDPRELAPYTALASLLLNMDETVTKQ